MGYEAAPIVEDWSSPEIHVPIFEDIIMEQEDLWCG